MNNLEKAYVCVCEHNTWNEGGVVMNMNKYDYWNAISRHVKSTLFPE